MASRLTYPIVAAVGIALASGAAWWYQNKSQQPPGSKAAPGAAGAPPSGAGPAATGVVTVDVARVEVVRLTDDTLAVGNLRSRQSVVLRPEVSGRVTRLNFRDGERVRKGQLLVQLDDQLPLAQVKQSEAELSIALANHRRNQELLEQNFISKRTVDESAANLEVAKAKLALSEASAARLRVLAPFDGIAGIRAVSQGDYLKDGADIVNIEDIDAVYVDFRLPERFQTKVKKGQRAAVDLDALPGQRFSALIQAIDPLLDANGRSVAVRGCIDNRQLQLRPGMFARVTAVFGEREKAKVVPEEAIVPLGVQTFVIKVVAGAEPGSKVSQRVAVKVGIRRPGRVEIVDGLNEGDIVVIAGQQRLQKDGSPVLVLDANKPQGGGVPAAAVAVAKPAGKPAQATKAVGGSNPCLVDLSGGGGLGQPGSGGGRTIPGNTRPASAKS